MRIKQWIKNKFYLKEMEFGFDISTNKYWFRAVRRRLWTRSDGWREYSTQVNSISVPLDEFRKFAEQIEDSESFIKHCEQNYRAGR